MDPSKNTSCIESKLKSRSPFGEIGSNGKEQKPQPGCFSWYDSRKDSRKEQIKKHDEDEETRSERSAGSGPHETFGEGNPETYKEEQLPYQNFGYGAAPVEYMNGNRTMMPFFPAYGPMTPMNSQWTMNPMEGMNVTSGMNMSTSLDMTNNSVAGMNPYAYMGMAPDPNFMGMMGMANYGQYGMMGSEGAVIPPKDVLHFGLSTLYPPSPTAPPPSTRPKPPGCRTVFVGGIPENATEEVMKELFKSCGEICTVRMSKKNFCHIRFAEEANVDSAICYSGYRIKVGNKDDAANTGRLHVDYAQARDDQYEYECRQRSLQREARHRERYEQDYYHPPTPPPVTHYTDHEASVLGEKLRGEETFQEAVFIVVTWLERGECNKRNAGYFYSMIQSTNSHVRRLMTEKHKFEDELTKAKALLKQQMRGILLQFNEIGKVFNAASLQKVWDHFTKAQRKNIEIWKKQTTEIKDAHVEEVLRDRVEVEMDVSEDEEESVPKMHDTEVSEEVTTKMVRFEEMEKLKEENDSLRCQLMASQNEMTVISNEMKQEREAKQYELQAIRETFSNCYKELWKKRIKEVAELKDMRPSKIKRTEAGNQDCGEQSGDRENEKSVSKKDILKTEDSSKVKNSAGANSFTISEMEGKLIGLISTFLNVHPFGASVDYICSYLHQVDAKILARDVEILLKKFPTLFREQSTGIGASLEKKWFFSGFASEK